MAASSSGGLWVEDDNTEFFSLAMSEALVEAANRGDWERFESIWVRVPDGISSEGIVVHAIEGGNAKIVEAALMRLATDLEEARVLVAAGGVNSKEVVRINRREEQLDRAWVRAKARCYQSDKPEFMEMMARRMRYGAADYEREMFDAMMYGADECVKAMWTKCKSPNVANRFLREALKLKDKFNHRVEFFAKEASKGVLQLELEWALRVGKAEKAEILNENLLGKIAESEAAELDACARQATKKSRPRHGL